jgi:hypothetical protein
VGDPEVASQITVTRLVAFRHIELGGGGVGCRNGSWSPGVCGFRAPDGAAEKTPAHRGCAVSGPLISYPLKPLLADGDEWEMAVHLPVRASRPLGWGAPRLVRRAAPSARDSSARSRRVRRRR